MQYTSIDMVCFVRTAGMEIGKKWSRRWLIGAAMAVIAVGVLTVQQKLVAVLIGSGDDIKGFPRDMENKLQRSEVRFVGESWGPESIAFDTEGRGPYTGVSDGRILRWDGPRKGWTLFALTSNSSHGSAACASRVPVAANFEDEDVCGRPLGLRFHKSGELYIADAYFGLCTVGTDGGLAKPVVTQVEGTKLTFTNDVDFDADGLVYFTDSSSKYQRRNFVLMFLEEDNTGRLITYDPQTGATRVLLRGLLFPNGVAVSKDGSFLLISETITCRLLRYWLKGPKSGEVEVFASLPGYPDNVRLTEKGEFWVAIHAMPNPFLKLPLRVRRSIINLSLPFTKIYSKVSQMRGKGMIIRYDIHGQVLEVLEDSDGLVVRSVSEVVEKDGMLWLGSVLLPQIAVYHKDEQKYQSKL